MIRYFIPGVVWTIAMWLLFLTPVTEPVHRLAGGIPSRSLIHCVMFLGFSHLWLAGMKKQLKYEFLRRKSFVIIPPFALVMIAASEIVSHFSGLNVGITHWNIIFDTIGTFLGILSFKLLYNQCY